jgi:hypothetical protein
MRRNLLGLLCLVFCLGLALGCQGGNPTPQTMRPPTTRFPNN